MSSLLAFRSDQIPLVWTRVRPLIMRALEYSTSHTIDDVAAGLDRGDMQLWVYGDFQAAMVTQIHDGKKGRFCLLLALAGEPFDDYAHHLSDIERWAKSEGCEELRIYGRMGWRRKLRDFQPQYTLFTKEI